MRGRRGYKNFEDFKEHVIDRSKTRCAGVYSILWARGMRGPKFEDNLADMEPEPAAAMAKKYPHVIVGVKRRRIIPGRRWTPVENAVKAGTESEHSGVMVDFWRKINRNVRLRYC